MEMLKGRVMLGGRGAGPALVTRMPMNFTAAFTKPVNLLPSRRAEIQDRHHELYRKNIEGSVLVFPACIGSTFTGMVILQLIHDRVAPAAVVVQEADSLLVSGSILGRAWFELGFPIVEYKGEDLFDRIKTGDEVEVDGDSGKIIVDRGSD
jgi:predicted aconitase with swiveling domain